METASLLEKLIQIERAISTENATTLRNMVVEVEEYILQTQRQRAESAQLGSWMMRLVPPNG
jgi:hypothetical protein